MRIFLSFLFLSVSFGFALTLEEVRSDLRKNVLASDSIELGIKTTESSPSISVSQVIGVHLVRKGPGKVFAEIKMPMSRQRMIVNGNRMKTIDLDTRKSRLVPYDGKSLDASAFADFNPLDSGEWAEPEYVSENLYSIRGAAGTLYYNPRKKRIERMEAFDAEKSVETEFAYDAANNPQKMTVRISVQGVETTMVTEILKLGHSKDFPDKLFEF